MARNRMIKPEFWEDPTVAQMSRDARLLFIGIWNHCDDVGVSPANPRFLRNKLFPYDDITLEEFSKWLQELVEMGRIIPVEFNKTPYYLVPNFLKHQKIDKPNLKAIYIPKSYLSAIKKELSPNEDEEFDDDSTSVRRSFDDDSATIQETGGRQREIEEEREKEKEVKEKEKRSSNKFSPPSLQEVLDYFLEKKSETGWADFICDVEARKFINFYDSKNWYVGRNKMTKWKSAAAGWITRAHEFDNGLTKNGNTNKPTSTTTPKSFGTL